MNREGRTVNVKDWGRLGAKRVVLYEDRGEVWKSRTSCISEGLERAEGACTERGKRKME